MLTRGAIRSILADELEYLDWSFHVGTAGDALSGRMYLQVQFPAPDMHTGVTDVQRGRKWFLSPHMTRSEIVTTALKAVLTAIEHEAREQFRYRGRAIFGPHFDVDALVEFAAMRENIDVRTGRWVA